MGIAARMIAYRGAWQFFLPPEIPLCGAAVSRAVGEAKVHLMGETPQLYSPLLCFN
jgi:hypothetical protein